jgi:competence protein ComEC
MHFVKKHYKILLWLVLIVANFSMWQAVFSVWPKNYFTIAVLDVGQGDAIYIESPTHNKIIVDGGPAHSLQAPLRQMMSFFDKKIDAIVVTNPDTDHYAGFFDILNTFSVGRMFEPGTISDTKTYHAFDQLVTEKGLKRYTARRGMVVHLGSSTALTILYPDRDVSAFSTNNGSIVAKLTYGSTSVMLTGDAPQSVEEYVLDQNGTNTVASTLLKVGHHGSHTSTGERFVTAVKPSFALISAGRGNKYGHPHADVMHTLSTKKIPTLVTSELGTIVFRCTTTECRQL